MNANDLKIFFGIDLPMKAYSTEICQNGHGFIIKWKCGNRNGFAMCCSVCRKKYSYNDLMPSCWDIIEIVCNGCLDKHKSSYRELERKIDTAESKYAEDELSHSFLKSDIVEKEAKLNNIKQKIIENNAILDNTNNSVREITEKFSSLRFDYDAQTDLLNATHARVVVESGDLTSLRARSKEILDLIRALPCSDSYPDVLKAELARLTSLVN